MAIRKRIPYEQCPLCEEKVYKVVREVDISLGELMSMTLERKLQWRECSGCGHIYADGYWSVEIMQKILDLMPNMAFDLQVERVHWARIVEKLMARWGAGCDFDLILRDDARWLDVGCGHGIGLTVAEEYGFEVLGIDLRQWSVDTMKAWGYAAIQHSFDEYVTAFPDERWDVVVLAEFLEHCPFPVDTLKKAKSLLRPRGVVYASTPSRDSVMWRARDAMQKGGPKIRMSGGVEATWGQIEHYHAFSRKHLEDCFRRAGLEPVAFHIGERYFETMEVIGR